eukprot:CAMPEP_0113954890 /NCGR_PEP_ID=MMETSP0011_2-20120614/920_1 /TAXON_ID=101924 /ORGANISM="Rhodosorus marinus" /LENGTH=44 /DNA_ID=CAMNT_0000964301 /DNA_START=94 /DNA_END=228 /DNA_ORIENTATION=+ /assembly_acc=CAM_ASM_000156
MSPWHQLALMHVMVPITPLGSKSQPGELRCTTSGLPRLWKSQPE